MIHVIMTCKAKVVSPFITWSFYLLSSTTNAQKRLLLRRSTIVQFSHTGYHDPRAYEQEANENVESTSGKECRHDGNPEYARIRVVFAYLTDHLGHHLSSTLNRPRSTHTHASTVSTTGHRRRQDVMHTHTHPCTVSTHPHEHVHP